MNNLFHEYTDSESVLLSPEGRARRERILAAGLAASARRGRGRAAARALSIVGVLALCAGAVWLGSAARRGSGFQPNRRNEVVVRPHDPPAAQDPATSFRPNAPEFALSPPLPTSLPSPKAPTPQRGSGIVVVTSTPDATHDIARIDDAQLLALLAETGGSYGLVAVESRVEVVRNDR